LLKPFLEEKRIMNTDAQYNLEAAKLSMLSRSTRIALGALLLAIPMAQSGLLGALAVLPLLAIYPILTGILGYGFVELLAVNKRRLERPAHLVKAARASLIVLGIGLIGIVMFSETAPVWLALLGIFPILMGLLDSDLLGEAVVTRRALQASSKGEATFAQTHQLHKPTRTSVAEEFSPKQAA
jgi:multidrug transporter EmrE-like cation transporter